MGQWLNLLLLVSELSLVLSNVIVIKLDDDVEAGKITSIIESKIRGQNKDLQKLKDNVAFLNSTFTNAYNAQRMQIKNLTEQNKEIQQTLRKNGMYTYVVVI